MLECAAVPNLKLIVVVLFTTILCVQSDVTAFVFSVMQFKNKIPRAILADCRPGQICSL